MFGYLTKDYWCDIGNTESYLRAHKDMLDGKCNARIDAANIDGVWYQGEAQTGMFIEAPSFIGRDSHIEIGAHVGPYAVVGRGSHILSGARVDRSVLWDNTLVDKDALVEGAVLCTGAEVSLGAEVLEAAAVGERTIIGENTRIFPAVGIWPDKSIEGGQEINENVVWGDVRKKIGFGPDGISGILNTDIAPEDACRIGSATAACLNGDMAVAHDGSEGAAVLCTSLAAGIAAQGKNVSLVGEGGFSHIMLCAVRCRSLKGGIYIYADGAKHVLGILDEQGLKLQRKSEKKILEILERKEYDRASSGNIETAGGIHEGFIGTIAAGVDVESIASQEYKVCVKASGSAPKTWRGSPS